MRNWHFWPPAEGGGEADRLTDIKPDILTYRVSKPRGCFSKIIISCTSAYGPQQRDTEDIKIGLFRPSCRHDMGRGKFVLPAGRFERIAWSLNDSR